MRAIRFKFLCIITILTVFTFSSCGSSYHEGEYYSADSINGYNAQYITINPAEEEAQDHCIFLADFDYLMALMEDTFPFFDMVYRMHGIDIRAQGEVARDIIVNYPYSLMEFAYSVGMGLEDMPEMDEYVFWSILAHDFFGHFSFAHLGVFDVGRFNMLAPFVRGFTIMPLARFNHNTFTNPASSEFYREFQELTNAPIEDNLELIQIMARMDLFAYNEPVSHEPFPPTLITESIEEGRIAYMEVTNFLVPQPGRYRNALRSFYQDIQDYDHLIIDIRRNRGGALEFARGLIMHPLMIDHDNLPDMPLYVLYRGSEMGRYLGELHIESQPRTGIQFVRQSEHLIPIYELIAGGSLGYLNEDDLQNLEYGFRVNTSLKHNNIRSPFPMPHIPFHGQIWILTSNRNASSSAMFARQAKYMNFATLVGETVSGHYTATYMVYFYLPNTGIIVQWDPDYLTDEMGRALNEFTTTPHYFNRDGMCALETVLAMIDEG